MPTQPNQLRPTFLLHTQISHPSTNPLPNSCEPILNSSEQHLPWLGGRLSFDNGSGGRDLKEVEVVESFRVGEGEDGRHVLGVEIDGGGGEDGEGLT